MKNISRLFLLVSILGMVACGGGGNKGGTPNPPLGKLSPEQKESFLQVILSLSSASNAVSDPSDSDKNSDKNLPINQTAFTVLRSLAPNQFSGEEMRKRVVANCKFTKESDQNSSPVISKRRVTGAGCPVEYSEESQFTVSQTGTSYDIAGSITLSYRVIDADYRRLSDVGNYSIVGQVSAKATSSTKGSQSGSTSIVNSSGQLESAKYGILKSYANFNFHSDENGSKSSSRIGIQMPSGQAELRIESTENKNGESQTKIYINNEELSPDNSKMPL